MIKPNYAFEKRQRELAKKKKKAEKESRKTPAADELTGQETAAESSGADDGLTSPAPDIPGATP
ncbi:MAG TPA: hypothetical protein VFW49_09195 [Fluviicoccus sp.]|nr:hypothetical protein [Fluviicoccus sp.]